MRKGLVIFFFVVFVLACIRNPAMAGATFHGIASGLTKAADQLATFGNALAKG